MWPEPLPQSLKHPLTRKIPSAGSLAKSSALLRTIPDAILSSANWLRRAYMRSSSGAAIPRSAGSVSIFRAPASWSHRPSAIPTLAWHEDRSRTQPVAEQIDTPDRGCVGASVNRSGGRIWRHARRRGGVGDRDSEGRRDRDQYRRRALRGKRQLVSPDQHAAKIKAVRETAQKLGIRLFINARTDPFLLK